MDIGDLVIARTVIKGDLFKPTAVITEANKAEWEDWATAQCLGQVGEVNQVFGFGKVVGCVVRFAELELEAAFLPEHLEVLFTK